MLRAAAHFHSAPHTALHTTHHCTHLCTLTTWIAHAIPYLHALCLSACTMPSSGRQALSMRQLLPGLPRQQTVPHAQPLPSCSDGGLLPHHSPHYFLRISTSHTVTTCVSTYTPTTFFLPFPTTRFFFHSLTRVRFFPTLVGGWLVQFVTHVYLCIRVRISIISNKLYIKQRSIAYGDKRVLT